jgi:peptidoglycan/xylan/chitin deacetylase (PgdA/CDA1 family)
MIRSLTAKLLNRSGLRSTLEYVSRWSGLVALNYHRIGDGSDSSLDRALWSADADSFARQVRFLKSHLDLITPDDLPAVLGKRRGRFGMITFDDGYRDNFEAAYPVLQAEGVKATFFIASGFMGTQQVPWWDEIAWMVRRSPLDSVQMPEWLEAPVVYDAPDRVAAIGALLRAFKKIPYESTGLFLEALSEATRSGRCAGADLWMTWDMVRSLRAAGMAIGGHTVTHPVLSMADPARQKSEIIGSIERIAQELREPVTCFSYPVGGRKAFNEVTVDILRAAGIRYAFTYYGGFRRFDDWVDYDVRRIAIEPEVHEDWFRCLVTIPGVFAR